MVSTLQTLYFCRWTFPLMVLLLVSSVTPKPMGMLYVYLIHVPIIFPTCLLFFQCGTWVTSPTIIISNKVPISLPSNSHQCFQLFSFTKSLPLDNPNSLIRSTLIVPCKTLPLIILWLFVEALYFLLNTLWVFGPLSEVNKFESKFVFGVDSCKMEFPRWLRKID